MWRMSWANLQLMAADSMRIDYKAGSGDDDAPSVISLDNGDAFEHLKRIL